MGATLTEDREARKGIEEAIGERLHWDYGCAVVGEVRTPSYHQFSNN